MFPEALSLQVRLARIREPPPQWRSPPRPAAQHQDMPAAQADQQVRLGIGRGLGMAADLVVETGVDQKALIGMRPPEVQSPHELDCDFGSFLFFRFVVLLLSIVFISLLNPISPGFYFSDNFF